MNQITVSLSHNREFNHAAAAQRVSALLWPYLGSQEISSLPLQCKGEGGGALEPGKRQQAWQGT